jgi:hypothetical protein
MRTTKTLDEISAQEMYDQMIAYLTKEVKNAEGGKKPIPSPMDFQMSEPGEWQEETDAIYYHNTGCDSAAETYRSVADAMQQTYVTDPQRELDQIDLNKFGAGI